MKNNRKILQDIIGRALKKKRFILAMASVLAGILVFEGITHGLNRMFVKEDEWYRILWHHFYEDAGKIDNVYLGSSHVYCDINPTILDQLSGQYNFNLASSSQRLNGSYYLLREAGRTNKLSHVYLELYYSPNYDDTRLLEYHRNWQHTDYMKLSLNREAYMLAAGEAEQYVSFLFPFSRYRVWLGDWNQIRENIERKRQDEYNAFQCERVFADGNGKEAYMKQGYYKSNRVCMDCYKIYQQSEILAGYSIGERNEKYIRSIIEYCKEREIPITLFVSPIYDLQLISTVHYDDYVLAVSALAEECDVPFYDFNLVSEEYLPIQDGKFFKDIGHLNQYGAEKFTPFFYQVVSGEEADNKKYFCDSYEERLRESAPSVYGVYVEQYEEGDESSTLWIASNRGAEMEYRIVLKPDGKKRRQIQDFEVNMKFQVPSEEHGICTIAARVKEEPTKMQTMSIRY